MTRAPVLLGQAIKLDPGDCTHYIWKAQAALALGDGHKAAGALKDTITVSKGVPACDRASQMAVDGLKRLPQRL